MEIPTLAEFCVLLLMRRLPARAPLHNTRDDIIRAIADSDKAGAVLDVFMRTKAKIAEHFDAPDSLPSNYSTRCNICRKSTYTSTLHQCWIIEPQNLFGFFQFPNSKEAKKLNLAIVCRKCCKANHNRFTDTHPRWCGASLITRLKIDHICSVPVPAKRTLPASFAKRATKKNRPEPEPDVDII
jgi:hypothetical protein